MKSIRSDFEDWGSVEKSGECFAEDVSRGEFGFLFNLSTGEARMVRGNEVRENKERLESDGGSIVSYADSEILFLITPETPII